MVVYNKHKDNPYIATYELYHWEAHPAQNDDSHEFNEVPGDWWYQQPFTKPDGLEHRKIHHDCYKDAYPEVTIPCLIDDGSDGSSPCYINTQCSVSKKFKAMYTSIVTIGLDGKVAFAAHWPPELSGNWTDAQAKQWVQREYPAWGEALDSLLATTGIINNPAKAKQRLTIRKNAGSYSVYSPFSGSYSIAITNVHGKQLASFTTSNGSGWYTVPGALSSGMYMVSIRTPEKTIVSKIWFVR